MIVVVARRREPQPVHSRRSLVWGRYSLTGHTPCQYATNCRRTCRYLEYHPGKCRSRSTAIPRNCPRGMPCTRCRRILLGSPCTVPPAETLSSCGRMCSSCSFDCSCWTPAPYWIRAVVVVTMMVQSCRLGRCNDHACRITCTAYMPGLPTPPHTGISPV